MTQAELTYPPTTPSNAGVIEQGDAEQWRDDALLILRELARMNRFIDYSFTADQWHYECDRMHLRPPHHPNQWGIATREAYRRGIIKQTGRYVRSKRPEANGRVIPVWRAG